jgi:hypothetical protein
VAVAVVAVAAAADRDWYQDASRHGDGDGAEEQKGGYEAPECGELHRCHLPSPEFDLARNVR